VDSNVSSTDNDNFKKAFDMREFKVDLKPIIIYQKKESEVVSEAVSEEPVAN
jgi:hypothetical protein